MMDNHLKMDENMFDQLNRKVSVLDIDVGEMEIIMRADMDVPLSQYVPPPPLDEQFAAIIALQEGQNQSAGTKGSRIKKKKTKQ